MDLAPSVSIVIPLYNDEEYVGLAIESCLAQTEGSIEVIAVDDASTDSTVEVIESIQTKDSRVRLVRQSSNQSAFQARRAGIEAARAPRVMFLDGDDELVPTAVATALELATSQGADVVGFGSEIVKPDGSTGGGFEASIQPSSRELTSIDVLESAFPAGRPVQGQLWRYLFDKKLLAAAYDSLPLDLVLPRANDVPIAFLALMHAEHYVSTPATLYRYFFRRGASGHQVGSIENYRFIAGAIESIDSIAPAVDLFAQSSEHKFRLKSSYESARLSIISRVLGYVWEIADEDLRAQSFKLLMERVGLSSLARASADFLPHALPLLVKGAAAPQLEGGDPKHVLLRASNLNTGGAQGVVVAQAAYLARLGMQVSIGLDSPVDSHFDLPHGVKAIQFAGASLAQRIGHFEQYCIDENVDMVIDHWIFYHERWAYFALVSASYGIPTIGWLHNFAFRPTLDGNNRISFLKRNLSLLASVVALSETDVAYWKTLGIDHMVYLPNPPSPMLLDLPQRTEPKSAPETTIELVWWGRLQQSTKQVREIVEIGALLNALDVDFRVTIIGPNGADLKAKDLHALAESRGIGDKVVTTGPLHGADLVAAIEHAHVYVSTSVIEGYPLALVEAQALGLPIVMYELPWLAMLPGNEGAISVAQDDRRAAARAIADLASRTDEYLRRSRGAIEAASDAIAYDFGALYMDLIRGTLSAAYSPEPSYDDSRLLMSLQFQFSERLSGRNHRGLKSAREDAHGQRRKSQRLERELQVALTNAKNLRKKVNRLSRELDEEREGRMGFKIRKAIRSFQSALRKSG